MPDDTPTIGGHAIRPDRATYERFKAELTDVEPTGLEIPGLVESLQGQHPRWGLATIGILSGTAARPGVPSYSIMLIADETTAAAARLELDTDSMQ